MCACCAGPREYGNFCSCDAMANSIAYMLKKEKHPVVHPSRFFIYYNARVKLEHVPATTDSGLTLRDLCTGVAKWKYVPESEWPYDAAHFSKAPVHKVYADASVHPTIQYHAVPQTLVGIKTVLNDGYPILIGVQVYPELESDAVLASGIVPMPDVQEGEYRWARIGPPGTQ